MRHIVFMCSIALYESSYSLFTPYLLDENDAPWSHYGGHSYLILLGEGLPRSAAMKYCQYYGASLVSINTKNEENFLIGEISIPESINHQAFWSGAEYNTKKKRWQWADGEYYTVKRDIGLMESFQM